MHRTHSAVACRLMCITAVAALLVLAPEADSRHLNTTREPSISSNVLIVNLGQWADSVVACLRAPGQSIWLTAGGVVIDQAIPSPVSSQSAVQTPSASLEDSKLRTIRPISLAGSMITPSRTELGEVVGACNFILGNDPLKWTADVPMAKSLVCRDVYPNVDLELCADSPGTLRFRIRSGADPSAIHRTLLQTAQNEQFQLAVNGDYTDLIVLPSGSEQQDVGATPNVAGVDYGTYLGGTSYDAIYALAVGQDGAMYAAGNTESANFPAVNALDPTYNSGAFGDVFITKFSAGGSGLVYSTFIGGSGPDILSGVAVSEDGSVYLAGVTGSAGTFPIVAAYDSVYGGSGDAFVMKLAPAGNQIVFSTYVGGTNEDYPRGLAIDAQGNSYICGHTRSNNFPTAGGSDVTFNGGNFDAFVTKLNSSGLSLGYSSYLGGGGDDQAFGIALDPQGRAHVRGWTVSADFPTVNAIDAGFNGGDRDVFLTRLNSSGSALEYSTYLGGEDSDYGVGIVVDGSGAVYISGATRSEDFPLHNAHDTSLGGLQDLFVIKVDSSGQSIVFSTLLGGSSEDFNGLVAVDNCGQVFVTGYTYSTDFPMALPFDSTFEAGSELVVSAFSPDGSQLMHSSYISGAQFEFANAIVLYSGTAIIGGVSNSTDVPTTGGYDTSLAGDYDGYIAIVGDMGINDCGCFCACPADPACDGIRSDVIDVVQAITVAFRGGTPIIDPSPSCPFTPTDVNCSGATDVVDIVKIVSVAFRGGSPAVEYCDPCAL